MYNFLTDLIRRLRMTSFGRGRGWVIQTQTKDQILRRPGGTANNIVRDITDKIINYDVRQHISPQLIQEITDLMTSTFDKNNIKYYTFFLRDLLCLLYFIFLM